MQWPPEANVAVHLACGVAALVAGAAALLAAKGSRRHRRAGRVVVVLGGIAVATAVLGLLLGPVPPALVAVTLSASYQLIGGVRSLRLRLARPSGLDAALAVTALACIALVACLGPNVSGGAASASFSPAIEWSALGFVGAIAGWDLARHALSGVRWQRVRPLDHGLKMIGFYAAMASAGLGNLLPFAQPWSSVLPSIAGAFAMLWFALAHPIGRRAFGVEGEDALPA